MNEIFAKPPLPTRTLRYAKHLRHEMTAAEQALLKYLRAGRLNGIKFRRQHPIPPYVVDFCCAEHALVVELDGSQHTAEQDMLRTQYLQSQGWQVVRYWDNEVLLQTEDVVNAILNIIEGRDSAS